MFKPCPQCGFLVALIAGREASQRCPRCGSALVGEHETFEEPAEAPPRRQRREEPTSRGVVESEAKPPRAEDASVSEARKLPEQAAVAVGDAGVEDGPAPVCPPGEDAGVTAHEGPSFVRRRARPVARRARWPEAVAIATLALMLALQLLLAQRVELARDAQWRPLVTRACGVLGCDVPAWREPAAWRMLARGVRPDPKRPGVLQVTTTVRNDARWPQPPPLVVLSLSDVDGRVVGVRSVRPRDYGAGRVRSIAPGQSLDVGFAVREPAGRVESFDFRLR